MDALLTTTEQLAAVSAKARAAGAVALDTEFVWTRTYRAQLGIVQLGVEAEGFALDSLAGVDLSPLRELLEDARVVKILHDAGQDLLHLHHATGAVPKNVFDTQLAAAFSGFSAGMGLQKLLAEVCQVELPKTETLTDWTRRPLSPAQLEYALDDVRYLFRLRAALLARMEGFGTLPWFTADSCKYEDPARYQDAEPHEAWHRVKIGRVRLSPRQLAILRAVAATREELAQRWNLPRNWLGDDPSLVDIARGGQVGLVRHRLRAGQIGLAKDEYRKAVAAAQDLPDEELPRPAAHAAPSSELKSAVVSAMKKVETRAAELHVASTLLATRAQVTEWLEKGDTSAGEPSDWRWDVLGRELVETFGISRQQTFF